MNALPAHALALMAYPVAAWLIRLALTVATMPLVTVSRLVRSRVCRGVLRVVVGLACGVGGLLVCQRILGWFGHTPSWSLALVLTVLIAAFYVTAGWPFRATPQFADDMLSVVGEEAGLVAVALLMLLRQLTTPS